MNRATISHFLFSIFFFSSSAQTDYTAFVNPFIGTGGHGHTFPGATTPFGMVQLSPDTRIDNSWDGCSGYHHSDSIIYGFSHTHLSGTGIPDYCDILLMPTVNNAVLQPTYNGDVKIGYASYFSHEKESATAGYYAVHLDDDNIDAELTATARAGFHRYTYTESTVNNVILDLKHRDKVLDSYFKVVDSFTVEGYRRSQSWAQNQVVYFIIKFSQPIEMFGYSRNDTVQYMETLYTAEEQGTNLKVYFGFDSEKSNQLLVKVGISQTGMDGARKNLDAEIPNWDFEKVKSDAQTAWNKELGKIDVFTTDEDKKIIFYTALYHCMIHPSLANDVDGKYLGRDFLVHQLPPDQNYYTVFSLWDTYRALHPLLTVIDSARTSDFIRTFLLQYDQGGRLPVWELSSNETDCMIGYHSVSVIADAMVKGIKGFDYAHAVAAAMHSSELNHFGLYSYKQKGYISLEDDESSVSKTLEYAYDDWCIGQIAMAANDNPNWYIYMKRAQNYLNLYDFNSGFFRPKKNSNWQSPFDPYEVNFNYTEANAWQYLFAVPHDVMGLAGIMGGSQAMEYKLDSLFNAPSQITGRVQPDITGMIGQYAHGNEPSHHMAYLYNYVGAPHKTQFYVTKIMNDFYKNSPDGLIGNEDCGQMSAWYVLSAMGIYQVAPGNGLFTIGSPAFDSVAIYIDSNRTFKIIAHDRSTNNFYVKDALFNQSPYPVPYLSYYQISNGGSLELSMSGEQAAFWNEDALSFQMKGLLGNNNLRPIYLSLFAIVPTPLIQSSSSVFTDSLLIDLFCNMTGVTLYYTTDGSEPGNHGLYYEKPFYIYDNTVVRVIALSSSNTLSLTAMAWFYKTDKDQKVIYLTKYNSQYVGEGEMTLIDKRFSSANFRDGSWQGWWGEDMQVMIDLGKKKTVNRIGAEFLQDQRSWIMMPKEIQIEVSEDGKEFTLAGTVLNNISDEIEQPVLKIFSLELTGLQTRYIRITAKNYGKLPSWHIGAGGDAWIFCDEIFVE